MVSPEGLSPLAIHPVSATLSLQSSSVRAGTVPSWPVAHNRGCLRPADLTPTAGVGPPPLEMTRALTVIVGRRAPSLRRWRLQGSGARVGRRMLCTTTNDKLAALGFWQALGFVLVELRPGDVETDCLTGTFVAIAADVRTRRRATIVRCDTDHRHFGPRAGTPPSPGGAGMPRCRRRCSRRPQPPRAWSMPRTPAC